jgi:hypothetical protein
VDDARQSDKAGMDNKGKSDGGQHKERRGVENPNKVVDDMSREGEHRTRHGGG